MKTPAEQTAYAEEMLRLTDQLSNLVKEAGGVLLDEDKTKQVSILADIRKLLDSDKATR